MISIIKNNEIGFSSVSQLNEQDFFYKKVDILSAINVPKENQLSNRELEYFYCAYKCIAGGSRDLLDIMNISKYFKSFKDKNTAKLWLKRVIDKGWIEEYNNKYYLIGDYEKVNKLDAARFSIDIIKGAE
jgi:hypothetical protein